MSLHLSHCQRRVDKPTNRIQAVNVLRVELAVIALKMAE